MKIGFCIGASSDCITLLKQYGYDFYEANFTILTRMEDDAFDAFRRVAEQSGLPGTCFNCFFPPDLSLNRDVDFNAVREYAKKGISRIRHLGAEVAVIGSGRSRGIPEGYDRETAAAQFAKTLSICAEEADKYGIRLAIEPLNYNETNYINTVRDGAELCRSLGDDRIAILADFYHMALNKEDLTDFVRYHDCIIHTHLATLDERRAIPSAEDADSMEQVAAVLKAAGYDGRVSVETAIGEDFETRLQNFGPIADMLRR